MTNGPLIAGTLVGFVAGCLVGTVWLGRDPAPEPLVAPSPTLPSGPASPGRERVPTTGPATLPAPENSDDQPELQRLRDAVARLEAELHDAVVAKGAPPDGDSLAAGAKRRAELSGMSLVELLTGLDRATAAENEHSRREFYRELVQRFPDHPQGVMGLVVLGDSETPSETIRYLQRLVTQHRDHDEWESCAATLAQAYEASGDPRRAKELYQELIDREASEGDPKWIYWGIWGRIAMAELATKHSDAREATRLYQELLDKHGDHTHRTNVSGGINKARAALGLEPLPPAPKDK